MCHFLAKYICIDTHTAYTFVCQSIQQLVSFCTHKYTPRCKHLILDRRMPKVCRLRPRGINPPGCNTFSYTMHSPCSHQMTSDVARHSVVVPQWHTYRMVGQHVIVHCENHQPIPHGNIDVSKSRHWSHRGSLLSVQLHSVACS